MDFETIKWILFTVGILALLLLDLGVFHKRPHAVNHKEALWWVVFWFTLAMAYCGFVWWWKGERTAIEFLTGYIIEASLSVDNIFVFILIFSYFKVPSEYQHRVLFWGIIGALLMRGIMIGVGAALIANFEWVIYIFGGFLVFTGIRMALSSEHGVDPEKNAAVKILKRFMPVTTQYHGKSFFVKQNGVKHATPLLVALVVVELSDVIFAVDSIPAVFAVTRDPFVVFTSNVFAILGLRSLYFALSGVMHKFRFLKFGLAVVLTFVGVKMLLGHTAYAIPIGWSLGVVGGVLFVSVLASLLIPERKGD
ncbi:MAG: TerC family protein [Calditrichaeota bacterium]|nr:TerC family protein [Calditrichota bacterium]